MIEEKIEIVPEMVCLHDEGLSYKVEDVRPDLTGWELSHDMGKRAVNYVQLDDGTFPAGTQYSRNEEDFRKVFTIINLYRSSMVSSQHLEN